MNIRRHVIDIAMIVLLPVLMAYSLAGEMLHEVAGILMFALFIAHHVINRAWYKSLPKGKYTARRVIRAAVNVLLIIVMIAQPISGILMSKHLFTFIHLPGVSSTAREVHLCLAYWGFVLMSMHAGMHMGPVMNKLTRDSNDGRSEESSDSAGTRKSIGAKRFTTVIIIAAILTVSVYGIYAFFKRQLASYMFLRTSFAFFDFTEPRIYFFMDYIAMMVLFSIVGYCCTNTNSKS